MDGDTGEITVVGVVEESRFHFIKLRMTSTIKTKVGELGFRVHDEVENFSASPIDTQILYHINFGEPLLDAGSRFVAPLKTVVPRNARAAEGIKTWESYSAPETGFAEQVYFLELLAGADGNTQTMLKNAHGTRGVSLHYNIKQLPCYSVWKKHDGFRRRHGHRPRTRHQLSQPAHVRNGAKPSRKNPRRRQGEVRRPVGIPLLIFERGSSRKGNRSNCGFHEANDF